MRLRVFVLGALGVSSAAALCPSTAAAEEEVVVRGRLREPSSTTLKREEIRALPGAFGDPFRALEALPGSAPIQSATPYMILRGAPPGNTAVLIDGIPVPLLFHLAIGPSVVPIQLIDHVDYWAGGAPARFGRAVGGVVSAETRAPADEMRLYGQVRLFDAGAMVEAPFANGRAHALVAARYSYTAAALSLLSPAVDVDYSDYQARAGFRLGDRNEVSVFAFGSHDHRGRYADFPTTFSADFHRLDVRFDRALPDRGRVRVGATLGLDASANEQASTSADSARIRIELDRPLDATLRLRAGADASYLDSRGGQTAASGDPAREFFVALLYPRNEQVASGAHADLVWRPTRRIELVPGIRADLYRFDVADNWPLEYGHELVSDYVESWNAPVAGETTSHAIDPRLASRFGISENVAIVGTVGRYNQPASFFAPSPGLSPPGFHRGLQRAYQRSAGVEFALPAGLGATATAFSHEYRNVTAFTSCGIPKGGFDLEDPCIGQRKNGGAYGLEVLVRRSLARGIGGHVAYTLSRSTDEPVEQRWQRTVRRRLTHFDHPHVLNVALSANLGAGWTAGARLYFFTGRPKFATPGSERVDPFTRLDVRIEKRWPIARDGWFALVAEGLNVTFAREDYGVDCSGRTCRDLYGPAVVVPSIGVEAQL
jgi:outer membrane receptor protein involved in Fe transport